MSSSSSVRLAAIAVWCVPAMWAFNFMVARMAPGVIEPHGLALGRWVALRAVCVARDDPTAYLLNGWTTFSCGMCCGC